MFYSDMTLLAERSVFPHCMITDMVFRSVTNVDDEHYETVLRLVRVPGGCRSFHLHVSNVFS